MEPAALSRYNPDMHRLILACVLLLPLCARAQKPEADCFDTAMTQLDTNDCAAAKYAKADAELNRVYQAVLEKHKDDALSVKKLRAAQRAWLAFRDAELEAKYPHSGERGYYGSVLPMCYSLEKTRLTEERTQRLREWLDEGEEGDVCN